MLTYDLNRKIAATLAVGLAVGILTLGTLVYAAGSGGTQATKVASAAMRTTSVGEHSEAVSRLVAAADDGDLRAQWRLAHMYLAGREVEQNPRRALDYFTRIADQNADMDPRSADGKLVADSFVNLASLYASGVEGDPGLRNDAVAAGLYTHAATYFGEPVAQYRLGLMYADGRGVQKNVRRAISWLLLAARKQSVEAQGELGRLLVRRGDEATESSALRRTGLMWLEVARRFADPATQAWIIDAHESAFAAASAEDAAGAVSRADHWIAENSHTN